MTTLTANTNPTHADHTQRGFWGLTLAAIGVVYGDIGTSVLYAVKEVFGSGHVAFTPDNVYGILSIFFWTLTVIVSLKYVTLVLRADNHGEGGLVAMLALASQSVKDSPRLRQVLLMIGIFGTCLFYGDGVITPAISVLSAVEALAPRTIVDVGAGEGYYTVRLAPRVGAKGRVLAQGTPSDIVENADVRRVYLGEHFRM